MAREDCPAWCTDHDDESRQHHIVRICEPGDIRVSVRQIGTDFTPTMYVGGVPVEDPASVLGGCDVRTMALLMRRLGREDIAAAVDELAALVTGEPAL